jgi:hypothetical protein
MIALERDLSPGRRFFMGGSDARVIMGDDETDLIRLWCDPTRFFNYSRV